VEQRSPKKVVFIEVPPAEEVEPTPFARQANSEGLDRPSPHGN